MAKTVTVRSSNFCCGLSEMGNFAYVNDSAGGYPHYHRPSGAGSDRTVKKMEPTGLEEIMEALKQTHGGVFCSVGEDQEYMGPMLEALGFKSWTFTNGVHTKKKDGVTIWFGETEVALKLGNKILQAALAEKKSA